jgi:hypothetical protein
MCKISIYGAIKLPTTNPTELPLKAFLDPPAPPFILVWPFDNVIYWSNESNTKPPLLPFKNCKLVLPSVEIKLAN